MTPPRARRALLSVSDKSGIVELARELDGLGFELISTGGTARALAGAGLPTTEVAALTGFPEIMDGRVKTLHPGIHGGLLGRAGTDDAVMREHGIRPIDVVVVNLYPFAQTISRKGCTDAEAIENIDVGGPAMLRAAAKNHERVTVLVAPADYEPVLRELRSGGVSDATRKRLAARAFAHTAAYDSMVSAWLRTRQGDETMPDVLGVAFHKKQELRYGENPHQRAAFYADPSSAGASIATASQLQGKELSYNNIADADTALECVRQFGAAACVIVKHANPCGVAVAAGPQDAYFLAYEADPVSAFGGIIAFNLPVDARAAKAILERQFVEVIVAPGYDDDALRALAARQNVRVLRTGALEVSGAPALDLKSVSGGLLAQTHDDGVADARSLRQVTRRAPDEAEIADLLFAWTVCKFVKSNAIVLARGGRTIGIGPGQASRVVSTRVAAMKAEDARLAIPGSVMASDAFFPFRDGLDAAAKLGVRAVIQPGGSVRDAEVVAAADEHGIAMVFTGVRHFRH